MPEATATAAVDAGARVPGPGDAGDAQARRTSDAGGSDAQTPSIVDAATDHVESSTVPPKPQPPPVFSGGTASVNGTFGMHDLAEASNTVVYRSLGGQLYIHEIGWGNTNEADRKAIVGLFPALPIYETGQNQIHGALETLVKPYWSEGAYVTCVNMNVGNGIGVASVSDMQSMRDQSQGLSKYVGQYYSPNDGKSFNTPFSDSSWDPLRAGAKIGGALCIDAPPQYYLASAPAYEQFTADEVAWGTANGIVVVFSLFPMQSADYWSDTQQLVANLASRGAAPSIWAVNGYYGQESDAVHPIGSESTPNDSMYTALKLLQTGQ